MMAFFMRERLGFLQLEFRCCTLQAVVHRFTESHIWKLFNENACTLPLIHVV